MDYTAGPGRQAVNEPSPTANQTTPANFNNSRTFAATGGSAGMNISTGGPHILLFERDQQLVALLTSELQLAGYECHAARTAVEVFDAIARYPIRLVLVDLAQAAAARREFWVALDTQRRGRGVQVLTFHCINIAGYGPSTDDFEDRSHNVLADIEVDGMLGIMNMVNAIRSRIAVSNTSAMPKISTNTGSTPSLGSQGTAPLTPVPTNNNTQSSAGASSTGTPYSEQVPFPTNPSQPSIPPPAETARTSTTGYTDKIRAVIYPNQRSWNTSTPPANSSPTPDSFAGGQGKRSMGETTLPGESGLAQLSRMLEENQSPLLEELAQGPAGEKNNSFQEDTMMHQRVRPNDGMPISAMPLRASPIQDIPTARISTGQSDSLNQGSMKRPDEAAQSQSSSPLMSIAAAQNSPAPAPEEPAAPIKLTVPAALPTSQNEETDSEIAAVAPGSSQFMKSEEPATKENVKDRSDEKRDSDNPLKEQPKTLVSTETTEPGQLQKTPDKGLLLDIVQSLPPMTSLPPQPQVRNGRATRSLGSVLLEGHLVPQNRLEVAQGIQRMLRGVDLNYQLGEILLMFKLLTPDQLLAASLVSYGLITAAQISALGRIRQELHSIGLEYDLENLLILFRILTSEQLREIHASWSG